MSLAWRLAAVPVLIGLNAFFVAAEYAVVALRPAEIETLRKRGKVRTAAAIARLKADPASAIGTIQVCITMTNLLLGWIGEPAMGAVLDRLFGPLINLWFGFEAVSTALSFIVVTLLTVVFSELLPKALTLRYATPAALLTAVPVGVVGRVVRPLVWLMNTMANAVTRPLGLGGVDELEAQRVTAEELRLMATQAAEQGVLSARERSLVLNALAIGRRRAKDIMVPRTKAAHLDLRWSMADNRRVVGGHLYSRLPLCDGGMDNVVGVVHTKEFLAADYAGGDTPVLSLIARRAAFVPETVSLERLLGAFRESESEMLFLASEYGGVEGIVTLQDVVDELVGPIGERAEREPAGSAPADAPEPAADGSPGAEFEVPGDAPLSDVAVRLGLADWPAGGAGDVATVGGLVVSRLERIPPAGATADVDGVWLRVVASDGRSVGRVAVRPPVVGQSARS